MTATQGGPPEIPDELHILAGEYVLGALDDAEMRAVRRRAKQDAALEAAIAGWERRLSPLAVVVPPAPPPEALWARLERAIAVVSDDDLPAERTAPAARPATLPRPLSGLPRPADRTPSAEVTPLVPRHRAMPSPRRVWPWQFATVASLALAAGIAAVALVPSVALRLHLAPPPSRFAALMPADSHTPGFLAAAQPDGSVVLTALSPVSVPPGHDLELWILRPGDTAPASLGVLPPGGRRVLLASLPPDGTKLMVSLEPPGGSPTGAPTGPVLYAGALEQRAL